MNNFQGPGQLPPKGIYLLGSEQADSLSGTDFADEIHGLGGNDTIFGGLGDDRLFGDAGKDTLLGGAGNDTLDGGSENDVLIGGAGADTLIGGAGYDIASYADATLGVMIDFRSGGALNDAAGDTFVSIEKFVGSNYGDTFIASGGLSADFDGGAGEDWLYGAKGADTLNGGSGNDHLSGGIGSDFLYGGTGLDTLTGGESADTFWLTQNSGLDTITDFNSGGDRLMLSAFGADPLGEGGRLTSFGFGHPLQPGDAIYSEGSGYYDYGSVWYSPYEHTLYSVEYTTSAIDQGSFHSVATVTSATAIATFSDGSHVYAGDLVFV
jgi:Ca2+-binding RTX toxin-like protein